MKQYKNTEYKLKKEVKALKKEKNLYGIAKKSSSRCKIKNIKKIKNINAKASKKRYDYISNSSSD